MTGGWVRKRAAPAAVFLAGVVIAGLALTHLISRLGERLVAGQLLVLICVAPMLVISVPVTIARLRRDTRARRLICAVALFIVLVGQWVLFATGLWVEEFQQPVGDPISVPFFLASLFVTLGWFGPSLTSAHAMSSATGVGNEPQHSVSRLALAGALIILIGLAVGAMTYIPAPSPVVPRARYWYLDAVERREQVLACGLVLVAGCALFATVLRLSSGVWIVRNIYWGTICLFATGLLALYRLGYWTRASDNDFGAYAFAPWFVGCVAFVTLPGARLLFRVIHSHWQRVDRL